MKNIIMFDIETVGTAADSVVLSIGAAGYDQTGSDFNFHQVIEMESQLAVGRKVNPDTLKWWMGQSKEAQQIFTTENTDTKEALISLNQGINKYMDTKKLEVWGNGANFDITIMENLMQSFDLQQPWKFWNIRCYRTLKNLFAGVIMSRSGIHHNALDDARSQLNHLKMISDKADLGLGHNA